MKIKIFVDGGMVSEVYSDSNENIEVEIGDMDCAKVGEVTSDPCLDGFKQIA